MSEAELCFRAAPLHTIRAGLPLGRVSPRAALTPAGVNACRLRHALLRLATCWSPPASDRRLLAADCWPPHTARRFLAAYDRPPTTTGSALLNTHYGHTYDITLRAPQVGASGAASSPKSL